MPIDKSLLRHLNLILVITPRFVSIDQVHLITSVSFEKDNYPVNVEVDVSVPRRAH
jgi:hypothetical protein